METIDNESTPSVPRSSDNVGCESRDPTPSPAPAHKFHSKPMKAPRTNAKPRRRGKLHPAKMSVKTTTLKTKTQSPSASIDKTRASKRRYRPGTLVRREIIACSSKTNDETEIPKRCFSRLVREIAQQYKEDLKFQSNAMQILHQASEQVLKEILEEAYKVTIMKGNLTLSAKDLRFYLHSNRKVPILEKINDGLPPMFFKFGTYRGREITRCHYIPYSEKEKLEKKKVQN